MRKTIDAVVVSGIGIDTNIYLHGRDIDFSVEANFTTNIDYVGQAGGYASRGFAQLGRKTALIDTIGADYHGRFILKTLRDDRINTDGIMRDGGGTRRSVNVMYQDGRRKNFYDGKGAMAMNPGDLPLPALRGILRRSRLAHFNIVNWSRYLLSIAREEETIISCDLQDLVHPDDPYRKDYIEAAGVLFFSSVNHENPVPVMERLLQQRDDRIVITGRGALGCGLATRDGVRFFPPVEDERPVIDTNGAGDALAVGFLTSYFLDGYSLEDAVLRGQIAARHTCAIRGSSDGLITRQELDRRFQTCKKQP